MSTLPRVLFASVITFLYLCHEAHRVQVSRRTVCLLLRRRRYPSATIEASPFVPTLSARILLLMLHLLVFVDWSQVAHWLIDLQHSV